MPLCRRRITKARGERWTAFKQDGEPIPADITTRELKSWTDVGDGEAKRFAGTAKYAIELTAPEGADDWEMRI